MNNEVSKIRQSNMELLRIIAMFLVLLVHADYFTLGAPTASDCIEDTFGTSLKVIFEAVSIACVNIFVCLSGCNDTRKFTLVTDTLANGHCIPACASPYSLVSFDSAKLLLFPYTAKNCSIWRASLFWIA